jgi:fructose 1,6-bisphosphatase
MNIERFTSRYIYGDNLAQAVDGEYVRFEDHESAIQKLGGSNPSGPVNHVVVGWMVGSYDNPAMYNLQEREQAFDAARRWNAPIRELVLNPDSGSAQQQEPKP